jgi:hypothetical protein
MRRSFGGVLLLAGVLAAWGGNALAGDSLRVNLPFGFGAGGKEFPKGSCNIDISTGARVSIQCSRVRSAVQAQTLAFVGSVYEVAERKEMVFNRYGDTYFLSTIWIANEGRELVMSDAEKELVDSGVEGTSVKLKVK